ncbi:hypothetical protein CPC08DRAFT_771704 [Agrocybe pediades]|nr:hypothetical protein CPC08DRAFT_771704 [Agrocybe pediades]
MPATPTDSGQQGETSGKGTDFGTPVQDGVRRYIADDGRPRPTPPPPRSPLTQHPPQRRRVQAPDNGERRWAGGSIGVGERMARVERRQGEGGDAMERKTRGRGGDEGWETRGMAGCEDEETRRRRRAEERRRGGKTP